MSSDRSRLGIHLLAAAEAKVKPVREAATKKKASVRHSFLQFHLNTKHACRAIADFELRLPRLLSQ